MNYTGKYVFSMPTSSGAQENTLLLRNYYDGTYHGTLLDAHFGSSIIEKLELLENSVKFRAAVGPATIDFTLTVDAGDQIIGTAVAAHGQDEPKTTAVSGRKMEITDEDDKTERITYKKKALIMYASITGNTKKIAEAFRDSFEHYGWAVDLIRITNKTEDLPFSYDDYDVVCLGSLIIAGSPTMAVTKKFSLGGGTDLEANVTKNAEAGKGFNEGGVGLKGPGGPGGPSGPLMGSPSEKTDGPVTYAGGPAPHGVYHPLGIVFTTYGGGFYGSNEAMATLELEKLYLELKNVQVIGTFACCGKEFGPAGLADGVKPTIMGGGAIDDPVYYKDADGNYHAGSYFFHTHMNSKPCDRDIYRAKALVADIIEDYFYSFDGIRKDVASKYICIS